MPNKVIFKNYNPGRLNIFRSKTDRVLNYEVKKSVSPSPGSMSITPLAGKILTPGSKATFPVERAGGSGNRRTGTMINVKDMRFINPNLGKEIAKIPFQERGAPRDKINAPVSPVREITDEVIFEDPGNASKKYYIPRFRLAEEKVSGVQQFQVFLRQEAQGGSLTVFLEKYPAEKIRETCRSCQEIESQGINVILKHGVSAGSPGIQVEHEFQELVKVDEGICSAVLRMESLSELTAVYQALINGDFNASLVVRRSIKAAIPIDSTPGSARTTNEIAVLKREIASLNIHYRQLRERSSRIRSMIFLDKAEPRIPRGKNFKRVTFLCKEKDSLDVMVDFHSTIQLGHFFIYFSTDPDKQAEVVIRCWQNRYEIAKEVKPGFYGNVLYRGIPKVSGARYSLKLPWSRIFGALKGVKSWLFAMDGRDRFPDKDHFEINYAESAGIFTMMEKMREIKSKLSVKQRELAAKQKQLRGIRQVPLFREVTRVLDHISMPQPFVFPPALHPYVTRDVVPDSNQKTGLIRRRVGWNGDYYSYYQDEGRRNVFYYLPDCFKIARRAEFPHHPLMSLKFEQTDKSLENIRVQLEYVAVPFVNPDRLEAAADELKSIDTVPGETVNPVFEPIPDVNREKITFILSLPRADSSAASFQEHEGAMVSLKGIKDELSLSMDQFQRVYDAMFGASEVIFNGKVEIEPGVEDMNESIPFVARMDDLAGDIFQYDESPDEASGGVKAVLKNAIESPVKIKGLTAVLIQGDTEVEARIEGVGFDPPPELASGETMEFVVAPVGPLPGDGPVKAEFDFDNVSVSPNPEAVWNAILNPGVRAEYSKTITVKTFKDSFSPPADKPEEQIMAVLVDFERGDTVELTAEKLEAGASIHFPISDIILRREEPGTYRYRIVVIRKDGQFPDDEWRTGSMDILYPEVS